MMTSSGRRNGSTNNNKEMIRNETLQSALECVVNRQLGKAVNLLENYLYTFVQPQATEQLEELKTDYQLMAEYWQRGFEDPERERLYDKLLHRMYVLVSNEYIRYYIKNSSFAKRKPHTRNNILKWIIHNFHHFRRSV